MKRIISLVLLVTQTAFVMAQSPLSFGKKVKYMPKSYAKPSSSTQVAEDGGTSKLPWIVFSDRADNYTTTSPGGSLMMKKLNFMEPFYVSQEENGYLKLIKYKAGMIRGRKINDKKTAISYGWIPKSKLLLWQRSYSNPQNGYSEKAIAIINGKTPLTASRVYFDNTDSVYVYDSPELKKRIAKIRLHEITYVYKKSEDDKKYLIGNEDQLVADSARKSITGWVGTDAIHNWGDRLYIAPKQFSSYEQADSLSLLLHNAHADPLLDTDNDLILRSAPIVTNDGKGPYTLGVATDVYNKSGNSVITINGASLPYSTYLNLRKNIHKINVIFVLDGGSPMRKYFSGLRNTIQSFENVFNEYDRKNQISYGAVVYRDAANCTAPGIFSTAGVSPDYRKLMDFLTIEARKTERCTSRINQQPVYDGIRSGLNLLNGHVNETNLVVLIGSTGNEVASATQLSDLSEEFARADARLLSIQMYSDYDPTFNNFVLQSKRLVSESAVYLADRKKRFMVKGEGLNNTQAYNTSQLDSVSYYLDYPKNSLIQGGVVFPAKGAVNSNELITVAVKRFMKETDYDINSQINSLDSAFRLTGIERKKLSPYVESFLLPPVSDDVADKMPHNAFKYYLTSSAPADIVAKNKNLMQYIVVLNTMEYKQINDIFSLMIGQNLQPDQSSFRSKLLKNYLNIPKNLLDLKISKGEVKDMTLAKYIQTVIGLPVSTELLDKYKVGELSKSSKMPQPDFEAYIKFLMNTSDNFKKATQVGQQFISNGKNYYYITEGNFNQKPETEKP